jgi:hypothetical protein
MVSHKMLNLHDVVAIPIIGEISINRVAFILNNNYNDYKWRDNLTILDFLDDNIHTANIDVRCHHYLIFKDSEQKSIEYCNYIWNNTSGIMSVVMCQLMCHRLYEKYGYSKHIDNVLDQTIRRATDIGAHKWIVSGRFFKASYSKQVEEEFIKILNSAFEIDLDCFKHKISFVILWLWIFGSEQSKEIMIEYVCHLPDYVQHALMPYLAANRAILDKVKYLLFSLDWQGCYYYLKDLGIVPG